MESVPLLEHICGRGHDLAFSMERVSLQEDVCVTAAMIECSIHGGCTRDGHDSVFPIRDIPLLTGPL